MASGDVSHTSVSPSVKEQQRKRHSWVGEEMNPGSRALSEMQLALQVLSINYRAWASRWSLRENRPLAHIKFNGVWTPNSLSLFENQNPTFSRYICGQVKSLIPLQTATFLEHCVQQSRELSLRWWGIFLMPSVGSRKKAGGDMDSRGLDRELCGQAEEHSSGTMVRCTGWFTTPS